LKLSCYATPDRILDRETLHASPENALVPGRRLGVHTQPTLALDLDNGAEEHRRVL